MGMFDNVYDQGKPLELPCPSCHEPVTGFQSKDGPCQLENVDWRELRNCYSYCPACKRWVEFNVLPATPARMEFVPDEEVPDA